MCHTALADRFCSEYSDAKTKAPTQPTVYIKCNRDIIIFRAATERWRRRRRFLFIVLERIGFSVSGSALDLRNFLPLNCLCCYCHFICESSRNYKVSSPISETVITHLCNFHRITQVIIKYIDDKHNNNRNHRSIPCLVTKPNFIFMIRCHLSFVLIFMAGCRCPFAIRLTVAQPAVWIKGEQHLKTEWKSSAKMNSAIIGAINISRKSTRESKSFGFALLPNSNDASFRF